MNTINTSPETKKLNGHLVFDLTEYPNINEIESLLLSDINKIRNQLKEYNVKIDSVNLKQKANNPDARTHEFIPEDGNYFDEETGYVRRNDYILHNLKENKLRLIDFGEISDGLIASLENLTERDYNNLGVEIERNALIELLHEKGRKNELQISLSPASDRQFELNQMYFAIDNPNGHNYNLFNWFLIDDYVFRQLPQNRGRRINSIAGGIRLSRRGERGNHIDIKSVISIKELITALSVTSKSDIDKFNEDIKKVNILCEELILKLKTYQVITQSKIKYLLDNGLTQYNAVEFKIITALQMKDKGISEKDIIAELRKHV